MDARTRQHVWRNFVCKAVKVFLVLEIMQHRRQKMVVTFLSIIIVKQEIQRRVGTNTDSLLIRTNHPWGFVFGVVPKARAPREREKARNLRIDCRDVFRSFFFFSFSRDRASEIADLVFRLTFEKKGTQRCATCAFQARFRRWRPRPFLSRPPP